MLTVGVRHKAILSGAGATHRRRQDGGIHLGEQLRALTLDELHLCFGALVDEDLPNQEQLVARLDRAATQPASGCRVCKRMLIPMCMLCSVVLPSRQAASSRCPQHDLCTCRHLQMADMIIGG